MAPGAQTSCLCHCPHRVWRKGSHKSHPRARMHGEHWCGTSPWTSPLKAPTPMAVSLRGCGAELLCGTLGRQPLPPPVTTAHVQMATAWHLGSCTAFGVLATCPFPSPPAPQFISAGCALGLLAVAQVRLQSEAFARCCAWEGRADSQAWYTEL
jgi:hypothetical protein